MEYGQWAECRNCYTKPLHFSVIGEKLGYE
jgi:hypothetical protein